MRYKPYSHCHHCHIITQHFTDEIDFLYVFCSGSWSSINTRSSTRCTEFPLYSDLIYLPPDNDGGAAVTGYLLERRSPGLEWIRLNDTPVTGLKHVADNLAPLTEYQFRVAAVNKFGISSFSDASEMITTKAPSVPDEPR